MATIPSIAMIPSGYKASKLYSVLPANGDGDFTTTRSTVATRFNKDGFREEVAPNIPRLDYSNGGCPSLLLEFASTNILVQSNQFDVTWSNLSTTVTSGHLGLDGTNSAWLLSKSANSSANIRQSISFSGIYTFSVYLKKGTNASAVLRSGGGTGARFKIDLSNGSVIGTQNTISTSIKSMRDNWYRCSMTFSASSNTDVRIYPESPLSASTAGNIYIQYAQLEQNSFATSSIDTQGTAQTRGADTANGSGNSTLINSSEGVLYAEISALAADTGIEGLSISSGSTSNRVVIFTKNPFSPNTIRATVTSSGVNTFDASVTISDITNINKIALKYKQNDFALWINGVEVNADFSGLTPIGLSKLNFGVDGVGSANFIGKTNDLRVYTTALSDSELTTLTTI